MSSSTPTIPGWRVLEVPALWLSMARQRPASVVDLLKRYVHVEEATSPRTIRAKVTGQILTLDASLQGASGIVWHCWTHFPKTVPSSHSIRHNDANEPLTDSNVSCYAKARCSRSCWSLKISIGSASRPRPCSTASSTACPRPACCCWSTTARSTSTAGAVRPTIRNCGSPLSPASAEAVLDTLLGQDPSLVPLKQLLIARTEAHFFLEESVRTLVEAGVLVGEPEAYRLTQALPTIQVPATVQAVLAARVDRLPPEEKGLLQTAAVVGTGAPCALLQAIADLPEATLHRGLAHLQTAEFLYETRLFPEQVYTFKHALTHEVAYGSLLLERRRGLHTRLVEAIEALTRAGGRTESNAWRTMLCGARYRIRP